MARTGIRNRGIDDACIVRAREQPGHGKSRNGTRKVAAPFLAAVAAAEDAAVLGADIDRP